jgi:hypothetical protein
MTMTWDQVHEAYCRAGLRPEVLMWFVEEHPGFALDLIEVTFVWLEMEWRATNVPEPIDTPEWQAFLQRTRRIAVESMARARVPYALSPI